MSDREATDAADHAGAAEAFVTRATSRFDEEVESVTVFGSTARGDATTLASDVDVLIVLADDVGRERTKESLRDLAYDVMLEYGPVVELNVVTRSEFETLRRRGNPFVRNVISEGTLYG